VESFHSTASSPFPAAAGNAETDAHDDGAGTMEAIYWGTCSIWGKGAGKGPWVMADLENGLWAGNERVNNQNVPLNYPFVMAMVKGGANGFALKAGDATQGKLALMYDGPRPNGYQPMKKQGSIVRKRGASEPRSSARGPRAAVPTHFPARSFALLADSWHRRG